MTKRPRQPPHASERGRDAAAERQERRAAALRDNLKKRKEQARARRDEKPAKSEN